MLSQCSTAGCTNSKALRVESLLKQCLAPHICDARLAKNDMEPEPLSSELSDMCIQTDTSMADMDAVNSYMA